jgi:hypothetical protein
MKEYLNTIPTKDILEHLMDRFDVQGEGFVYGYYTANDVELEKDGYCVGGIGNRPLQLGLARMVEKFIDREKD